jgi:hypothetical protein
MNKPINPEKTQADKDQDSWVQIGDAAKSLIAKLAERKGGK